MDGDRLDDSFLFQDDDDRLDDSFLFESDDPAPAITAEARPVEPTLWDSVQDFFTGGEAHRARASNELVAREIAEREGIDVAEVYESVGGGRPILNPEGRAPVRALAEGSAVVGRQLASLDIPKGVANMIARQVRGGDEDIDDTHWLDRLIEGTEVEPDPDPDSNYEQFQNLGKNLGYSLTTMATGIAAYAAGTAVSSPIGGTAASMAASGAVAFRGTKDEFLDRAREMQNAYFQQLHGRDMTQEEWTEAYEEFNALANRYGAWEAIPEAIGNAVFIRAFAKPLAGASLGKAQLFKDRAAEIAGRTAQVLATENITEVATALGQNQVELEAGMTERDLTLPGAIRETVVPTTLLTIIMGGTGGIATATKAKLAGKYDQQDQRPELFRPTHRVAGGQDAQVATKKGKVVPDTFVLKDGRVVRDSQAVPLAPDALDVSMDVSATIAATKDRIGFDQGIIGNAMRGDPYGQGGLVEFDSGIEQIDILPVPEVTSEIMGPREDIDILPTAEVELEGQAEQIDITDQFDAGPFPSYISADLNRWKQNRRDLGITENPDGTFSLTSEKTRSDLTEIKREQRARGIIAGAMQPTAEELEVEANQAATSPANELPAPTEAQIEAGNYKKGHVGYQGLDISVENPAGSKRRPEWPTLKHHYGYIRRTKGADDEQVDVFLNRENDAATDSPVFIIDQQDQETGKFDEHKVMIGFDSQEAAEAAYRENYTDDWKVGTVSQLTMDEFKGWLKDGSQTLSYDTWQGFRAEVEGFRKAKREAIESLTQANAGNLVGIEARNKRGDLWASVLKDASEPGKYRVQNYNASGFIGHQVYNSAAEALDALVGEGYTVPDQGAMNRLVGTPEWDQGMEAAERVRQFNEQSLKPATPEITVEDQERIESDAITRAKTAGITDDEIYEITAKHPYDDEAFFKDLERLTRLKEAENAIVPRETIQPTGKESRARTSAGQEVPTRLMVVELDQLIASNDDAGNINPAYPAELQPRDRSRAASQAQINKIAKNLEPELLGDMLGADVGAPIVGTDGVVESGNGRVLALAKAYAANAADAYRQYILENAASQGLSEALVKGMTRPVLVRVRTNDMTMAERAEFARQSNQSEVAPMSPVEQARADAARLTDDDMTLYAPSEQGNILAASNDAFLQVFARRLGDLATGGLSTADGRWTKQMADRVQAAVFYKAYGDERLLTLVAEEADPDIKNVLHALNMAAPAFARARSIEQNLGNLDIISDLVSAVDLLRQAKASGTTVQNLVDQAGLFGDVDPVIGKIAVFIESSTRSARKMGIGFTEMAKFLEQELVNLSQDSLFDMAPAEKADIIAAADRRVADEYGQKAGIQDLFSPSETVAGAGVSVPQSRRRGGEQSEGAGAGAETTTEKPDRVNMTHRDALQRIPELQAAAKRLLDGEISPEQYDELVNQYKPIAPYEDVPKPATRAAMRKALHKNKRGKIGKGGAIETGHLVGLRLDIPAYRDHNVWVPTVHEGAPGQRPAPIAHEATAVLTEATFPEDKRAIKVAAGAVKAPSAVIKGKWVNQSQRDTMAEAKAAMNDPAWIQVGFDPERHSYFYHRDSTIPVLSADRVIQVGGLVLAKNAKLGEKGQFLFSRAAPPAGMTPAAQMEYEYLLENMEDPDPVTAFSDLLDYIDEGIAELSRADIASVRREAIARGIYREITDEEMARTQTTRRGGKKFDFQLDGKKYVFDRNERMSQDNLLARREDQYVYHATFSGHVGQIKDQGLRPFQTSNWVNNQGDRMNPDGGTFAFRSPVEALRWALNMDFTFDDEVSIVKIRDDGNWGQDPANDLQWRGLNTALKRPGGVPPGDIIESFDRAEFGYAPEQNMTVEEWLDWAGQRMSGEFLARREDLPMDKESRLARAREMGFDTSQVFYHGTPGADVIDQFQGMEGAGWFSTSGEDASGFAQDEGAVYPVYLKYSNPVDFSDPRVQGIDELVDRDVKERFGGQVTGPSEEFRLGRYAHYYKQWGYDSIVSEGLETAPSEGFTVNVFEPSQVRSVNAAFDPAEDASPDLLARRDEEQADLFAEPDQDKRQQLADERARKDAERNGTARAEPTLGQAPDDLFANDGRLEPDLFSRRDDEIYAEMDGKPISYQVLVESTGEEVTYTVDAGKMMRDIDARLAALKELRNCI